MTVGIVDDVSFTSIPYDPSFVLEPEGVRRCLFYGMGGDGTVGASKNSCKIVGEETPLHIQACSHFLYFFLGWGAKRQELVPQLHHQQRQPRILTTATTTRIATNDEPQYQHLQTTIINLF